MGSNMGTAAQGSRLSLVNLRCGESLRSLEALGARLKFEVERATVTAVISTTNP